MIGKLSEIVIDTADMRGLSAFYGDLAGFSIVHFDDDWITTATPEGWKIAFQQADDHISPRWPDPRYPQQMHLDFLVADLPRAVEAARKLGATRLPGGDDTFAVLADTSGHPFCLCQREGIERIRLSDIAIDCPDGTVMARFYAALLDMRVTYEGAQGAMLARDGQPSVVFQTVATYTPPRWPDPAYPQQFHLDVKVSDIEQGEQHVLALGACRLPGSGGDFRVYADPVGHPFCLVW